MTLTRRRATIWALGALGAAVAVGPLDAHAGDAAPAEGGSSMTGMAQEARNRVEALDRKLDRLVRELRSTTAKDTSRELRDLQRRWRRLASDDCSWQSRFAQGGSVAPLVYSSCMETQLAARIQQLKPLLCEGAGMTGSCAASERF